MATEIDKWIEISRDCKYLPENDLKVLKLLALINTLDKMCLLGFDNTYIDAIDLRTNTTLSSFAGKLEIPVINNNAIRQN